MSATESGGNGEAYSNTAELRVAIGPLTAPLVCRVVSIIAARADCPVDRLDDALLICDAIAAHAPPHVRDGHLELTVNANHEGLQLRLGPLAADGGREVIADSVVPGVGSVLEQLADEISVEATHEHESLLIDFAFTRGKRDG